MSCEICGRSACIRSFHSLESQALFDERQSMPDDVETLRRDLQDALARIRELEDADLDVEIGTD